MKKLLLSLALIPLIVAANTNKLSSKERLIFKDGVLAANHCHTYYILNEQLFELKRNGDPKKIVSKFIEELGKEHVDKLFKFKGDKKAFLDKSYEICLKRTIDTGEVQKQ